MQGSHEAESTDLDACRYLTDEGLVLPRSRRQNSGRSSRDQRSSSQRDRARVLYSPYFQRLSGVTQVVSPDPLLPTMHNRQMHSIKVGLVAKEMAEDLLRAARADDTTARTIRELGGLDSVVCEVAGLAHDIGHPPFGHVGETQLDQFLRRTGSFATGIGPTDGAPIYPENALALCTVSAHHSHGFEGNAQTFRVLTRLDLHKVAALGSDTDGAVHHGLDLSAASLAAILKYPWWRAEGSHEKKYGVYPDDVDSFVFARSWLPQAIRPQQQSLEASVMDLADDITYAVHDLQDFLLSGLIDAGTASRLVREQYRRMESDEYIDAATTKPENFQQHVNRESTRGGPSALEEAYRKLAQHHPDFVTRKDHLEALAAVESFLTVELPARNRGGNWNEIQVRSAFSQLVGQLLGAIDLHATAAWSGGPHVLPDAVTWHMIQILKTLAKNLVIETANRGCPGEPARRHGLSARRARRVDRREASRERAARPAAFFPLVRHASERSAHVAHRSPDAALHRRLRMQPDGRPDDALGLAWFAGGALPGLNDVE